MPVLRSPPVRPTGTARSRQRGQALMLMLAIVVLGSTWVLVSQLNAATNFTVSSRNHNARVLNQAKQALIGYVAMQAAKSSENNPGRLPCPEAAGDYGDPAQEGTASSNCTLPKVGRLPWRTLGLDKLVDAAGEPLWYVVSPGWAYTASNLTINSNSVGQLTVDGQANDSVALIIAPGPAVTVAAAAGCASWTQLRPLLGPLDVRNYLECENATVPPDANFVTTGPGSSFNDQVLRVTAADVLPAIEAGVSARFVREFAPGIRTAYSGGLWPAAPVLPFAAPFGNPAANPTNKFQGNAGSTQGLLPVSYSTTGTCAPPCIPAPCDPLSNARCDPGFVSWKNTATITPTGGAALSSYNCTIGGTPSTLTCTLNTVSSIVLPNSALTFTLDATANNVGMALRELNPTVPFSGVDTAAINPPYGYTVMTAPAPTLNIDGSATIRISSGVPAGGGSLQDDTVCGLTPITGVLNDCYQHTIAIPMALFSDHPTVDASNAIYNWFFRNRWHEVAYYVTAPAVAPSGPRACTTGTDCLSVNFLAPSGTQRGVIIFAGRSLSGASRPNGNLSDWLEGTNADLDTTFAVRSPTLLVNRSFNDRVAVISANP